MCLLGFRGLAELLASRETQNLEFKDGTGFKPADLAEYAVAFFNAQQGPSRLVLGVSDDQSRDVVGTDVFPNPLKTARQVRDKVGVSVVLEEYDHEGARVLIAHCPESTGNRIAKFEGRYRIRKGDSLADMTDQELADRLTPEGTYDYSARVTDATFADLDPKMVASYVGACAKKSGMSISDHEAYLHSIDLLVEGKATLAAVILFGTEAAVRSTIHVSEISYVYSPDEADESKATSRHDYQAGMWGYLDDLWELIDNRNSDQFYQHKFTRYPIRTFDEDSAREGIINAITHRDYASYGHILVKQFRYSLEISSPGGFIAGVNPGNIMHNSQPRNELIAKAFQRTGKVERLGYGVAKMFAAAMQQSKPLPDFARSDDSRVRLALDGELVHTKLAEHIRHTPRMVDYALTAPAYQALCAVVLDEPVSDNLKPARKKLLQDGIIKSRGTGKATVYSLAIDTYNAPELFNGEQATVVEILVALAPAEQDGVSISSLSQAIAGKSDKQLRRVLNTMKRDGLVRIRGQGRSSRWVATDKGKLTLESAELA